MVIGVGVQSFKESPDWGYDDLLESKAIDQGCDGFSIDPESSSGHNYTTCLKKLNSTGHFIKEIKSICKILLYERRKQHD